jgi:hypothetical protein
VKKPIVKNGLNLVAIVMEDLMNKMFGMDNYVLLITKDKYLFYLDGLK